MTEPIRLPKSVHEIAEVIGVELTLRLIGMLPRRRRPDNRSHVQTSLYVPEVLPADHWLVRVLGWHAAKRLSDIYGGEVLQPPACAEIYREWRNREIQRMSQAGIPSQAIAEIVGISSRRVVSVLSGESNPTGGNGT